MIEYFSMITKRRIGGFVSNNKGKKNARLMPGIRVNKNKGVLKMEKIKIYQQVLERHTKDVNMKTNNEWELRFYPAKAEKGRENLVELWDGKLDCKIIDGTYAEIYPYLLGYKKAIFDIDNNLLAP